ncbi:8-oxoguanine deaminase, partial [Streptomyces fulvissimus]|nr:8-oxoguanine deaminase [Streptomyces microflavus]
MAAPATPGTADGAERLVIENAHIATVDAAGTEYAHGHLVVAGGRIEALGAGPAPEGLTGVTRRV